jgi:Ca2+-binding EF-hand superfamily protein
MKLRTILIGLAGVAAVAAVGGLTFHQLVIKPKIEQARAAVQTLALEYDTDKDSQLSRSEVDAAIAARFAKADANLDGKIDAAEFKTAADELRAKFPAHPFHRDQAKRYARIVSALDWNRDGGLEIEEVKGVLQAAAGFADRNADGFISKDEMNGRWGRHRGRAEARLF